MKITLIAPRLAIKKKDWLPTGPYWPVELAIFAAFLRDREEDIKVLDLFGISPTRWEDQGDHFLQGIPLGRRLKSKAVTESELAVVFAASASSHSEVLKIVKVLRFVRPDLKIAILENPQALDYSIWQHREDWQAIGADFLFGGEIYEHWEDFARFSLSSPLESSVPAKGTTHPIPAWDLFPLTRYWNLPYARGPKRKKHLPILTRRKTERGWEERELSAVVDEVCLLRDRFGIDRFEIEDPVPTEEKDRWQKITERLVEKGAEVQFTLVGQPSRRLMSLYWLLFKYRLAQLTR